jgi:catechol 2,3-dioxygenase-like lactoylglutathione lyase family enzyme
MKRAVESLIEAFEARVLSRRELIASLTALTTGAALASESASAQAPQVSLAAQGRTLNHASLAVSDVERSARFYAALLGLKEVSRPGNGGINLGLGTSFLGLYNLANPGTVNHICLGVDDFDPNRIAGRLKEMGITARVDTNPANRTSGGDQLYFRDPDNTNIQLSANGYQG